MCVNTSEGFFFVLEIVFLKVSRKSHYLYNVSDELAIYIRRYVEVHCLDELYKVVFLEHETFLNSLAEIVYFLCKIGFA